MSLSFLKDLDEREGFPLVTFGLFKKPFLNPPKVFPLCVDFCSWKKKGTAEKDQKLVVVEKKRKWNNYVINLHKTTSKYGAQVTTPGLEKYHNYLGKRCLKRFYLFVTL